MKFRIQLKLNDIIKIHRRQKLQWV